MAMSAILTGTSSGGLIGPFKPVLDRPIWLTLDGAWSGTVTLLRSTDGGASKLPVTYGDGSAKPTWSGNMQAPVGEESVSAAAYFLDFAGTGTLKYKLEQ